MDLSEAWNGLLELTQQVVSPNWGDLLQYIPLLLILLMVVVVALVAWSWQRNSARNRARVPARLPSGRPPQDLHLPGPSPWPFVAPVGLLLMLFAVVFGLGSLADLALLALGAMVAVIGVIGWLTDAGREYRRAESGIHTASGARGAHGALEGGPLGGHAALTAGSGHRAVVVVPSWEVEPPEGVHLPGPSAWPFLAPIGLVFALLGLVFGPALLVGGLLMGAIASVGWLIDAGRELKSVEAHGHAVPATRDPEKAFPKALGPVYVFVAGVALVITVLPWAISLLPGSSGEDTAAGPVPTAAPYLSAVDVMGFEQKEIAVFADKPFELTFDNKQGGVEHNVAIYDSLAFTTSLFIGERFAGPDTRVYEPDPLVAGTYAYLCSVHPATMTGTLYAR